MFVMLFDLVYTVVFSYSGSASNVRAPSSAYPIPNRKDMVSFPTRRIVGGVLSMRSVLPSVRFALFTVRTV